MSLRCALSPIRVFKGLQSSFEGHSNGLQIGREGWKLHLDIEGRVAATGLHRADDGEHGRANTLCHHRKALRKGG